MLSDFTGADKVYIACGYTDLRKGIDGLATIDLSLERGINYYQEESISCNSACFQPPLKRESLHTEATPIYNKQDNKPRLPKPYYVAMELMTVLPLRMVDNALYAFDGRIYRFVSTEVIFRLIMGNCRQYIEIIGDASLIERVYKVIQAEPSIVLRPIHQCRYVALEDGLLDLRSFCLRPHSPEIFVTTLLSGSFRKGQQGNCPRFCRFLEDIALGDSELVERIWQIIGYCMVPDTLGKVCFIFQGVENSGKSLLANLVSILLDDDTVTSVEFSALGERFGASVLVGKQLCLIPDMPSGVVDNKAVAMLKALTGGDMVTVDVKYQPRIKLQCQAKFIMVTNHPFLTKERDPALLSRIIVVPFQRSVPLELRERNLLEELKMEKDGIIYNGLLAYKRLEERKYRFAGNYPLNKSVSTDSLSGNEEVSTGIHDILWKYCSIYLILEPGSFLPSSELYSHFQQVTGNAYPSGMMAFSNRIASIIDQMFPTKVTRKRHRVSGQQERGFEGVNIRSYFDQRREF